MNNPITFKHILIVLIVLFIGLLSFKAHSAIKSYYTNKSAESFKEAYEKGYEDGIEHEEQYFYNFCNNVKDRKRVVISQDIGYNQLQYPDGSLSDKIPYYATDISCIK